MKIELTVTGGQDVGRVISLGSGATSLGRSTKAQLQLGDLSISRQHCMFDVDGDAVEISDAGSSSGTFVNSEPVMRQRLKSGDEIRVGNTTLRIYIRSTDEQGTLPVDPNVSAPKGNDTRLPDLTGTTLHDYSITRCLGEGRSGVVYLAHDTKKDRNVAVKVLKPEVSENQEGMQRFVRAMKTMFVVRHENLVRIYNAGRSNGLVWVAMEYVDGESMDQVIARIGTAGMLDWEYAFRVAVHSARALEAAAEHNIIHRNIRPENILMREADGVVKIGDTMFAKALEGSMAKQITQPGQLIGDLAYMAPEQTSHAESADGRSDIYSLGATCYALLTGRPPFEAHSFPALLEKVRNEAPEPAKNYQLSINDLFAGTISRMLEKRPEDRYKNPTALLKDLNRVATFANVDV